MTRRSLSAIMNLTEKFGGAFMKKAVCIFLVCVLFSITFSSCTKGERPNNVTESEMTANFEQNNANMIYVQTLDLYRKAIQLLPRYIDSKEGTDVYLKQLNVAESEKELFETIFSSAYFYYPPDGTGDRTSPIHKLSYGYKKPRNGLNHG